ncbi:MAG: hypothetical protein AAB922_07210, partial [Patescibacteria group bacterium]
MSITNRKYTPRRAFLFLARRDVAISFLAPIPIHYGILPIVRDPSVDPNQTRLRAELVPLRAELVPLRVEFTPLRV